MTTESYSKTKYMSLCGLFAALTAICSWISIPLGFTPIPMNLATLAVFLAGGLLGPKYGPVSITVYALAGAVGIPVFAGFRGGFSVLAGPTGGYIIGYIAAAFVVGLLCSHAFNRRHSDQSESSMSESRAVGSSMPESSLSGSSMPESSLPERRRAERGLMIMRVVIALVLGLAACYALGTLWFMISTNTNVGAALVACVIPFLPGDAIKITAATILLPKLHKFI